MAGIFLGEFGTFVVPSYLERPRKHRVNNEISRYSFEATLGSRAVEVEIYPKENETGMYIENALLILETHASMRKLLFGKVEMQQFRCLIFENDLMSLRKYLASVGQVGQPDVKPADEFRSFCKQMVSALRYIHDHQFLYNNLDPHNIAVQIDNRTGRSTFKLMDFSKTFDIKAPLTTDRYMFNIYKGTKRGDYDEKAETQTLGMMFRYITTKYVYMRPKSKFNSSIPVGEQSNKRFRHDYLNRFHNLCTNLENKSLTLAEASKHSFFKDNEKVTIMIKSMFQDMEYNQKAKTELMGRSSLVFYDNWLENFTIAHRTKIQQRNDENIKYKEANVPGYKPPTSKPKELARPQSSPALRVTNAIQSGAPRNSSLANPNVKKTFQSHSTESSRGFNPKIDTHPVYNFSNPFDAYRMFRNDMTHNQPDVEKTLNLRPFGLVDVFTTAIPMFVTLGEILWRKHGGSSTPAIVGYTYPKRTPYYNAAECNITDCDAVNTVHGITESFDEELCPILQENGSDSWEKDPEMQVSPKHPHAQSQLLKSPQKRSANAPMSKEFQSPAKKNQQRFKNM